MKSSSKIKIRQLKNIIAKAELLYQTAERSFVDGSPWTLVQFESLLTQPYIEVHVAEVAEDDVEDQSKTDKNEVVGLLVSIITEGESEIFMIGVAESYQNQSIGTRLFDGFKKYLAKNAVNTIYLEVRESNEAAQRFYKSHGFKLEGVRRKYYSKPTEDALVLKYKE